MRVRGIAGVGGAAPALAAWRTAAAGPGDVEIRLFQFKPEQLEVPAEPPSRGRTPTASSTR